MDNFDLLINWVEKDQAPSKTLVIDEQGRINTQQTGKGYLMCSYPNYQKYNGGAMDDVSSYVSTENK